MGVPVLSDIFMAEEEKWGRFCNGNRRANELFKWKLMRLGIRRQSL